MIRVQLYKLPQTGEIRLPANFIKGRRINANNIIVSFGQRQVEASLQSDPHPSPRFRVGLSSDLMSELGLRSGVRLRAFWDARKQQFRLGPVVAIMVWRYRRVSSAWLFGAATDMARTFVRLARSRGVVAYAFSPRDIDWNSKGVIGFVPAGRGWRRVSLPLPDVVYDRIQSRALDATRRMQNVKRQLMALEGLHYFNPCFLDKWDTYQALVKDPIVQRYLPRTEKLNSLDQLGPWLRTYPTVYIKPSRGSLGLGIVKISRMARGFRYQRIRMGGGSQAGLCSSLPKLERRLRNILPKRTMIIQQGLRLARYKGRPYDIRVMVQKTTRGNWVCTNMIARVASAGSAVSNVAEGGTMISVRRAIRGSLRINVGSAVRRIRRGARLIARAVEEQYGQEFGEFGIDMALDRRGRVWLIEVNAKPGRQTDEPGTPPSMRRVTRYAIAKAGFSERG